jgi:hypothetical protein
MKPFNRKDWITLMEKVAKLNIRTLEESYDQHTANIVNIRHDVDDDIVASSQMAKLEQELGIKSTYFILDTAPYWQPKGDMPDIDSILNYGQNIGWHNNAISKHLRTGKSIIDCISEPLRLLRQYGEVVGSASHGDPLCHHHRYLNYYIFGFESHDDFPNTEIRGNHYALSYFGLNYEAYFTGHTHYISDSGGVFYGKIGETKVTKEEALSDFEKNGGKLQILIHPQWWQL